MIYNFRPAPIPRDNPEDERYWKREALVYQSGFLTSLQGGLVAPRCFGVIEQAEDEVWLWLEDVSEVQKVIWSKERYALAAYHIGQFSGKHMDKPILTSTWLGQNLLRSQAKGSYDVFTERLPTMRQHPLVKRFLPGNMVADMLQLWDKREMFYDALDQLPQTICHRDACRINLFDRTAADGSSLTVAIDWEDVAKGPVGEDLVSLVIVSLLHHETEPADGQAFDAEMFAGYIKGLQASGWQGEASLVRFGYCAAYMRYAIGLLHFIISFATNENLRLDRQKRTGQSIEQIADHWSAVMAFVLARTDEAQRLMPSVKSVDVRD